MSKQAKASPAPAGPTMNTTALYALLGGFVAGGVIGYLVGAQSRSSSAPVPAVTAAPPGPAPAPPAAAPAMPGPQALQQIAQLELMLQQDPKNHDAWVVLGNQYFDTRQPAKAIDAYGKALALKPDNPDILTDQGTMYRETGQFEKAVANFKRAAQVEPKHVQSLFNLGVVYANDLHKPEEARKAWKKVIEVAPASSQAADARQALAKLDAGR